MNTCVVLTVMPYTVLGQPRLLGLSAALSIIGTDLLAEVGGTVSCLFLVGVCNAFYSSGLVMNNLPVVAGRFLGDRHVARTDRVCTHCRGVVVA